MRDPHEPSSSDCGAPYNLNDEGECECAWCRKKRRDEAREEYLIARMDDEGDNGRI